MEMSRSLTTGKRDQHPVADVRLDASPVALPTRFPDSVDCCWLRYRWLAAGQVVYVTIYYSGICLHALPFKSQVRPQDGAGKALPKEQVARARSVQMIIENKLYISFRSSRTLIDCVQIKWLFPLFWPKNRSRGNNFLKSSVPPMLSASFSFERPCADDNHSRSHSKKYSSKIFVFQLGRRAWSVWSGYFATSQALKVWLIVLCSWLLIKRTKTRPRHVETGRTWQELVSLLLLLCCLRLEVIKIWS